MQELRANIDDIIGEGNEELISAIKSVINAKSGSFDDWKEVGDLVGVDYPKAGILCYQTAIRIKPSDYEIYSKLAILLCNCEEYGIAEKYMNKAVEGVNNSLSYKVQLLEILETVGKKEEAAQLKKIVTELQEKMGEHKAVMNKNKAKGGKKEALKNDPDVQDVDALLGGDDYGA